MNREPIILDIWFDYSKKYWIKPHIMQNIFIVGEFINRLNLGLGMYMTHMYCILLKVFEHLQMLFI